MKTKTPPRAHHHHAPGAAHDHDAHSGEHEHHHDAGQDVRDEPRRQTVNDETRTQSPLSRDSARESLLFLDAPSGLAGDMIIAALVDLGVPFAVIEQIPEALGLAHVQLSLEHTTRQTIAARHFQVKAEADQPARSYRDICELIDRSTLSATVKARSHAIFKRLGEAEAEVHGVALEQVHFHEVGAVDALIDIVGAAASFDYLGAPVECSPLPMGRGYVRAEHGRLPLPAPATLLCLRGVPTYDAGIDAELVTPTGAAIIAAMCRNFTRWPDLVVERVGWGAGSRSLPDRPNALRAVLGKPVAHAREHSHVVVECNVDDMTGELAAHALGRLIQAGALDVWATPVVMKKGRPGLTISALCQEANHSEISQVMLTETSSIGLRFFPVSRVERPRSVTLVSTPFGEVPVKVSAGPFGPPEIKPEFDRCAELAQAAGVPVREVVRSAQQAAQQSTTALESLPVGTTQE